MTLNEIPVPAEAVSGCALHGLIVDGDQAKVQGKAQLMLIGIHNGPGVVTGDRNTTVDGAGRLYAQDRGGLQ